VNERTQLGKKESRRTVRSALAWTTADAVLAFSTNTATQAGGKAEALSPPTVAHASRFIDG
jgi:hypothetical protein